MKENAFILTCIILLITGCGQKTYFQIDVENPVYRANTVFRSSEDLSSPKFAHLGIADRV